MSDDFVSAAVQYGLRCIGKESLAMKPEQLEAVRQVCFGMDDTYFFGCQRGLESRYATNYYLSLRIFSVVSNVLLLQS